MNGLSLRELRENAGLTQTQLAAKLKIAPATVSNAEAGKRNVSVPLALEWIEACGATLVIVPALTSDLQDLVQKLAAVLPQVHQAQIEDLKALVHHWRQESVKAR